MAKSSESPVEPFKRALAKIRAQGYSFQVEMAYIFWQRGYRIREVPIWMFLLICIPTLAVLSAWGMLLEKGTNALMNKLISTKKGAGA